MVKIVDLRPTFTRSSHAPERKPTPQRGKLREPKKPTSLKTRRRRIRIAILIGGLVIVALLLYAVHWFSYRPSVRIQDISVRGAMLQEPGDVSGYVRQLLDQGSGGFIARDNIFAYPKEELRAGVIRTFPRLKSVRIGRGGAFGTTLIVNVDERRAYATWCRDADNCFVFDEGGLVFAGTVRAGKPELPYIFYGGLDGGPVGMVFLPEQLRGVIDLLQRMREARFTPVSVHVLDAQDYTIELSNGFTIKASFGQDIDTIVHNLQLVSVSPALRGKEADLEYIDLRFGNRVYYKFKGVEKPTEAEE
jgi:cell division septal protein FtsQ